MQACFDRLRGYVNRYVGEWGPEGIWWLIGFTRRVMCYV